MPKKSTTQRPQKHKDLPPEESEGQPPSPREENEKDTSTLSYTEIEEPIEMEIVEGASEKDVPAFTLSVGKDGIEPKETLYVYKDQASGTKVVINVVSVAPEMIVNQEEAGKSDGTDREEQEDDIPMTDENQPLDEDRDTTDGSQTANPDKTVEKQTEHSCRDCGFVTTKKHEFQMHRIAHAKPDKNLLYHCPECSYTSQHRFNVKTHLKRHADITDLDESEKFKCKDCEYSTLYKHDLMTHAKKHDPEKRFNCFYCNFTSIYRHSLLHHISSKHGRTRPHQCPKCPYSSARKQDLEIHMYRHSEKKKFKCTEPDCDYETPYKQSLKTHMNRHKGISPFECSRPGCTFTTTTKANLRSHIKRHESRLHCETCNFETASVEKLAGHVCSEKDSDKMEGGEKEGEHMGDEDTEKEKRNKVVFNPKGIKNSAGKMEFRCTECDYKTPQKCRLKKHILTHDMTRKPAPKIYSCQYCAYQTGYQNSLKRHMARHSLVKPLKCGHCEYSAINMSQMRVHIAKHTGVKPFKCNVCNYATANKQHLVVHMCKHSKLRFKCNSCDYMTPWSARMRIHLKQHVRTSDAPCEIPCEPREPTVPTDYSVFDLAPANTEVFLVENSVSGESSMEVASSAELEGIFVAEQLAESLAEMTERLKEDEEMRVEGASLVQLSHAAIDGSAQESSVEIIQQLSHLTPDSSDEGTESTLVIVAESSQSEDQVNAGGGEDQQTNQITDGSSIITGDNCYIITNGGVLAQHSI